MAAAAVQLSGADTGVKRTRASKACDACHRSGCRCSPGSKPSICARCELSGSRCTYNRPSKRRGPPYRRHPPDDFSEYATSQVRRPSTTTQHYHTPASHHNTLLDDAALLFAGPSSATTNSAGMPTPRSKDTVAHPPELPHYEGPDVSPTRRDNDPGLEALAATTGEGTSTSRPWQYEELVSHDIIVSMMQHFYSTGYPLRPYFHWPSFMGRVGRAEYKVNRGMFAVTMAVCAMVAASPTHTLLQHPEWRIFYDAVIRAMPLDANSTPDIHFLKAKAILSALCVQTGDLRGALNHAGDYCNHSATLGFHIEANWPANLKESEKEERRRLYWYMYQHDIYLSTTFGYLARHREAKTTVQYPAEVLDDEDITDTYSYIRPDSLSWLRGSNYCADLYRMLEHITGDMRTKVLPSSDQGPGSTVTALLARAPVIPTSEYLAAVQALSDSLPSCFKAAKPMTGDPKQDRVGFLALNCIITTHTIKLILASNQKSSLHHRCAIAGELLDDLSGMPPGYINASNMTTLHHLAGVGNLLSTAIRPPLTAWTYLQVRNILLVLADYLASLEPNHSAAARGLADKLRSHIDEIDWYINQMAIGRGTSGSLDSSPTMARGLLSRWVQATVAGHDASVSPPNIQSLLSINFPQNDNSGLSEVLGLNAEPLVPAQAPDSTISAAQQQAILPQNFAQPALDTLPATSSLLIDGIPGTMDFSTTQQSGRLTPRPTGTITPARLEEGTSVGATPGSLASFWDNFPQLDFQNLLMSKPTRGQS